MTGGHERCHETAESREPLEAAAELVEQLATVAPAGQWRVSGLLATRPEVLAERDDGSTEHVAEARAGTARWIVALSPATAPALVQWLRRAARSDPADAEALAFARALLGTADPS